MKWGIIHSKKSSLLELNRLWNVWLFHPIASIRQKEANLISILQTFIVRIVISTLNFAYPIRLNIVSLDAPPVTALFSAPQSIFYWNFGQIHGKVNGIANASFLCQASSSDSYIFYDRRISLRSKIISKQKSFCCCSRATEIYGQFNIHSIGMMVFPTFSNWPMPDPDSDPDSNQTQTRLHTSSFKFNSSSSPLQRTPSLHLSFTELTHTLTAWRPTTTHKIQTRIPSITIHPTWKSLISCNIVLNAALHNLTRILVCNFHQIEYYLLSTRKL